MSLISEMQGSILDENIPIGKVLRQARILAYRLNNQQLQEWIESELDGYSQEDENWYQHIPSYRTYRLDVRCDVRKRHAFYTNYPLVIPEEVTNLLPPYLQVTYIATGLPSLMNMIDNGDREVGVLWPPYVVEACNKLHFLPNDELCSKMYSIFPSTQVLHIVNKVRNHLLTLVLELEKAYPDLGSTDDALSKVSSSFIINILNITTGGEGNHMSIFDQKGQSVGGNQYNAAGDINFNQTDNRVEYAEELSKLLTGLQNAIANNEINEEIATDAEYNVKKAAQLSKKDDLDQSKIRDHLTKAKEILGGVTSLAGFVVAIDKAISVLDRIV